MTRPVTIYYLDVDATSTIRTLVTDVDHLSPDANGITIHLDPVPPHTSGDDYFQPWSRIARLFYPGA